MEEKKQIIYVDIQSIRPNPYQPRTVFSDIELEQLAQSIESYGVIQPISVRKFSEDHYELIAGERRLRAAKLANLKEIPVIVEKIQDNDSALIALIENVQRKNLNYIEEAESYQQLMDLHGMTQEQIAKKVGKTQSTVANKLRLLRLEEGIRNQLIEKNLTERHGRALLKIPDSELQEEALKKINKQKLNVGKTEELVEKMREEILTNNHNEKITKGQKARVKGFFNTKIYTNTIKQAYNEVLKTGINATYKEKETDEAIEIIIRINKSK
ncbi:MAG TPA: nucleoid occlusion protein [Eubacteriaceae bacterium]|nr:nucleoid occlusion protein [Eubacteriaceae bacterium]